jgi:cytochrome P450
MSNPDTDKPVDLAEEAPARRLEVTREGLPPLAGVQFDVASTEDSLEQLVACSATLGDLYRVHAPGRKRDTWICNHPDDIKRLLVTNHRNYTKGVGLDRVKILLGNGIMVSEGDFWKRQRRMIQPAFHRRMVEQYAGVIDAAIDAAQLRWDRAAAEASPLDVTAEMSTLTLDIILGSIFGEDLAWLEQRMGGNNPFAVITEHSARDLAFAYKFRSLARLVGELVEARRAGGWQRFDFLQMLMDARDKDDRPMPPREMVDEAMTLIVAGHETSASALNWTWYLLATHPEARDRLESEVDGIDAPPGEGPRRLGYAASEQLVWTQAVIKEAMRLYPPGWLLTRRSVDEDVLGGYRVPPGTDVMLSPYLIQRHPRWWPDPEAYRPERFLPAAEAAREKWVYIPFAAGPRHCVGENFALYEMTVHVARMARRYRLEYLDEGPIPIEAAVNLRALRPLRFRIHARNCQ